MKILTRSEQPRADRYPGVPRFGLADSTLGGTKLHAGDLTYEVDSAVPHHRHPDAEETQIMLEGELECWLDGHRFTVRAGDCIVAGRGVEHAFFNRSSSAARMLTAFAISPPTTEHTADPGLDDDVPETGVRFGLWPQDAGASETTIYPVNGPVGASETLCELLVVDGDTFDVEVPNHGELGALCVDGSAQVSDGTGDRAELACGDFVFAQSGTLRIGSTGKGPAKLLTVRSLI